MREFLAIEIEEFLKNNIQKTQETIKNTDYSLQDQMNVTNDSNEKNREVFRLSEKL